MKKILFNISLIVSQFVCSQKVEGDFYAVRIYSKTDIKQSVDFFLVPIKRCADTLDLLNHINGSDEKYIFSNDLSLIYYDREMTDEIFEFFQSPSCYTFTNANYFIKIFVVKALIEYDFIEKDKINILKLRIRNDNVDLDFESIKNYDLIKHIEIESKSCDF